MVTIVLASNNPGKLAEIQAKLANLPITLCPQSDFDIPEHEETGLSFIENAIAKARHAAKYTALAAIGDDSGLAVDSLEGAPGIYSARYAGKKADSQRNNEKLLSEMEGIPEAKRSACFHCTIAFVKHAADPTPLICEGKWCGRILTAPIGEHGFGYDPLFFVPTHQCSAAQLTRDIKNKISHRGQALDKLITLLRQ